MGRGRRASGRPVLVEASVPMPQVVVQTGPFNESSTQTIQEGISLSLKRRRMSCCYGSGEGGHSQAACPSVENQAPAKQKPQFAAAESGNEMGAGAMSHPEP